MQIYSNPEKIIKTTKFIVKIMKILCYFATTFYVFIVMLLLLNIEKINKIAIVPFIAVSIFIGYIYTYFYYLHSHRIPLRIMLNEDKVHVICTSKKYDFNRKDVFRVYNGINYIVLVIKSDNKIYKFKFPKGGVFQNNLRRDEIYRLMNYKTN